MEFGIVVSLLVTDRRLRHERGDVSIFETIREEGAPVWASGRYANPRQGAAKPAGGRAPARRQRPWTSRSLERIYAMFDAAQALHPEGRARTGARSSAGMLAAFNDEFVRPGLLSPGSTAIALENLALRDQLAVLQRSVRRPRLSRWDRILWVGLSRCWASGWRSSLLIVQPATVLALAPPGLPALLAVEVQDEPRRPGAAGASKPNSRSSATTSPS